MFGSSRKKQSSGSNFLTGLLAVGAGLVGGFLLKTLLDDTKQQKVENRSNVNRVTVSNNTYLNNQPRQQLTKSDATFEQMMYCPIGLEIMNEPMTISHCGHSFEKKTIYQYLKKSQKCPICRKQAKIQNLVPNYQLKNVIDHYRQTKR